MTAGNITTMGFDTAALRSIARARAAGDPGSVQRAMRIAAVAATIFSMTALAALILFADPLAGAFAEDPTQRARTAFLIRLGAPFVPLFALMTILRAATRGHKTVVPAVVIGNIVQPFTLLAGSTLAIVLGFGVAGAVGGLVASSALGLLTAVWFYRRLATPGQSRARSPVSVRSMTSFALPRAGERLFAISGLGVILLGLWGENRDVALFAVAGSLQSLVLVFPEALMGIWQPMIADLQQRGEAIRLESLYKTINRWVASASLWLAAGLLILPEPFVHLLGGQAVPDASIVTAVLALGTLINVGTGPSGMLITMAGYPVVNLLNSVFATTAYVLLAWKLVPAHGVLGMAAIQTLVVGLLNIARVLEARVLVGILPFGKSFAKPVIATMALGGVLVGWRLLFDRGLMTDTAGIVLASLIYAIVLALMGIDPEDRLVYDRLKERLAGFVPHRGRSA
jgi:O-antigen/teichoic acid export membrane protein